MADIDKQTGSAFVPVAPIVPELKPPTTDAAIAWSEFCDGLKRAGHLLLSQPGVEDEVMESETLRYLVREFRAGLEWETEHALYDFPRFFRADDSGSGPPGPNLDNTYYYAHVRSDASYRIVIDISTIAGIIISVTNRSYRNYGDYSLSDFDVKSNGLLEITISTKQSPGNWIQMPQDAYRLAVRAYYVDWQIHSPPALSIMRLGSEGQAAPLPTVASLSKALRETIDHLQTWPFKYPIFQTLYADAVPPNGMRPPIGIPGGGQEIQYGLARYLLEHDEALIIESAVPEAPYWGFHLYTMPWFSPIDVGNRVTSLNNLQSRIDADGKVRYVVSETDPGVQNWLDTGGFRTGAVYYRWIWSKRSHTPSSRCVKALDVRTHLPAETPTFTSSQRVGQISTRRQHLQRRFRA